MLSDAHKDYLYELQSRINSKNLPRYVGILQELLSEAIANGGFVGLKQVAAAIGVMSAGHIVVGRAIRYITIEDVFAERPITTSVAVGANGPGVGYFEAAMFPFSSLKVDVIKRRQFWHRQLLALGYSTLPDGSTIVISPENPVVINNEFVAEQTRTRLRNLANKNGLTQNEMLNRLIDFVQNMNFKA